MNETTTAGPIREATGWSMVWGILMFICGILAIAMPLASSISIVIVLGWLILVMALWHLVFAFQSRGTRAVLWQVLLALLYGVIGFYMLAKPLLGILSLTLVLAIFLLIEGVLEIIFYFQARDLRNAGWILFDGIVTLLLGILIYAHWPSSSVWVIGTLVGVSLIFSGLSRFMLALAVRKVAPATS